MSRPKFSRRDPTDSDDNDEEHVQFGELRAVTSRSPHPPSPHRYPTVAARDHLSASQPAASTTSSSPASTSSLSGRSERSLSLTQPSRTASSLGPSSLTSLVADVARKRRAVLASSLAPAQSSTSAVSSALTAYSWLFDAAPRLFPSTTILAAGTRPFEWLNTVDCTSPLTYLHTAHHIAHPSARGEDVKYENLEECCDCTEATQCVDGQCACSRHTAAMHTRDGLKRRTQHGVTLPPPHNDLITECNENCRCARWRGKRRCLNRVVQSAPVNPQYRLLVFHTVDRGWGALTMKAIPARQYVCEYIGEVISDALAESRSDKYLFSTDPKLITGNRWQLTNFTEPPSIDATQVGHIARFINHSCAPNCCVYQVLIEQWEVQKPHFAFFSNRDIAAGEELTIDYSYTDEHKKRLFGGPCKCEYCEGKEERDRVDNGGKGAGSSSGARGNGGSRKRALS